MRAPTSDRRQACYDDNQLGKHYRGRYVAHWATRVVQTYKRCTETDSNRERS